MDDNMLYKRLCVFYELGLKSGIINYRELVKFCDSLIEVLDEPPLIFIDLSLNSFKKNESINQEISDFHQLNTADIEFIKIVLGYISYLITSKLISVEDGIRKTYNLLVNTDIYHNDEFLRLYSLDDSLYLAQEGIYGQIEKVKSEFLELILVYEDSFDDFKGDYKTLFHYFDLRKIGL